MVDRRGWAKEIVLDADTGFFLPVPGPKALSEIRVSELSFSVQTAPNFRSYSRFLESSAFRTVYQTIVTAQIESKKQPERSLCVRPRVVEA